MTTASAKALRETKNQSVLDVDHLKAGLGKRTTQGAAIVVGAQVGRMALQLIATFFLARLLAPADFGLVAVGLTVLGLLNLLTDLGLTSVTVQTKDLDQNTTSALFRINVAVGAGVFLLLVLCAPALGWFFRDERVGGVVIGLATSVPIYALGAQHQALLMRNMKWGVLQSLGLGATAAGSLIAILSAWLLGLGYWALVAQAVSAAVIQVIGVWLVCPWRPSAVSNWGGARKALSTSLHLSGSMMLGYVHRQADNILIGWRWGSTELGYYARSYSLMMLPLNLINGPLYSAFLPSLSRLQDEPERWRAAYLDILIVVTILGGAIGALMFGGAHPIIGIVLGPKWETSEHIFSALAASMLVSSPMNTVAWLYLSLGRSRAMLAWGLLATAFYLLAFIVGLPYGGIGVATGYGLAQLLAFVPCMWMATRRSPVSLKDVLAVCAPIMLVTACVGFALRVVTSQLDLFSGAATIVGAGVIHLGLCLAICLYWPPHERVANRIRTFAAQRLKHFGKRSNRTGDSP